jgi:hypothetical protein
MQKNRDYKAYQIIDGRWYPLTDDFFTECCDCGLVHREYWKIARGKIYFKAMRHEKYTRMVRKSRGIDIAAIRRKPEPKRGKTTAHR